MNFPIKFLNEYNVRAILNSKILLEVAPLMDFLETPLIFKIINTKNKKFTFISVKNFSSKNDLIYIPKNICNSLNLNENENANIEIFKPEIGIYVEFNIIDENIEHIINLDSLKEQLIYSLPVIDKNIPIILNFNNKIIKLNILKIEPENIVRINYNTNIKINSRYSILSKEERKALTSNNPRIKAFMKRRLNLS